MTEQERAVPVDYMQNSQGHLVPVGQVKEYDMMRDQVVTDIVGKAQIVQKMLRQFREESMSDIEALVSLAAEKYEVKMGGKKGNVTITSFDGQRIPSV